MGNSGTKEKKEVPVPPQGKYEVKLIASKMGPAAMGGFQAFHTSVDIDGTEYFFDAAGVMSSSNRLSHQPDPSNPQSRFDTTEHLIGYTNKSGTQLKDNLRSHFQAGTYDLIRKNCNSFSDCALFYLCKIRLAPGFRSLETKGKSFPSLLNRFGYEPNAKADNFDMEQTILALDPNRVFKEGSGHSLKSDGAKSGGPLTKEELRAKRLAAMGMN